MSKVAVIVGSLRQESLNRAIARALIKLAPQGMEGEFIEIGDLPLYNPDLEGDDVPASWTRFRDQIRGVDAVLFVTPEYNRGLPASIKNAIDVGTRPWGQNVWSGKPAAVVTASPGAIGGFGANHQLRQSLVFLDMPVLQQPEAYIGNAGDLLNADDTPKTDSTRDYFSSIMAAFGKLIDRYS